jgi:TRAP-type C4-dicarboxylate transport system substrate-binding protein
MAPQTTRRLVLAGAAAVLATPHVARAQRARTLTITSILGPQSPQARVWIKMQEEVDRVLGPGRMRFNVVAGGVMGGERQEAEGIRVGTIQGSLSTVANLTAWVADGAIFDMPFIFRDEAHIARVMQGQIGQRLFEQYRQNGFRAVGHISYGSRNLLAKQPINDPDQARGRRMRVIPAPLHIELWRSLGANPTQTAITETYNALQTGVVDMMDFTKSGYAQLKLYEVAPHFSITNHIWALGVMYFGEQFWQSITQPERDAIMQAAAVSCPHFIAMANEDHDRALIEARNAGATIVEPNPAPWRAAMRPFWESFGPRVGGTERLMAIVNHP